MIKNAAAVLAAILVLNQRKHAAELTLDEEMALLDQKEQARKGGKPAVQAGPTPEQLKEQALLQKLKLETETRTQRERALAAQEESAASRRAVQTPKDYSTWKAQVAAFDDAVAQRRSTGGMNQQMRDQIQKQIDAHDARSNADIAASTQAVAPPAATGPAPGEPGSPEHKQIQSGRATYHLAQRLRLPQRAAQAGNAVARAVTPWFQRKQPQTGVSSNAPLKAPTPAAVSTQGIASVEKPVNGVGPN